MAKKIYFILILLAALGILVSCGEKEEAPVAPKERVAADPGVNRNQLLGIRRDKGDGDLELVLASGFVLEVDKKNGKLEVETNWGDDLGEIATIYRNERGGFDVALAENPSVVFIRDAEVKPDPEDGDMEITLSDGVFGYVLEIDRGDGDERPGSMEVEDKFGKDLFEADPVKILHSYNRKYPKKQSSYDAKIKKSYGFTWVKDPKKRIKPKKRKPYLPPAKTGTRKIQPKVGAKKFKTATTIPLKSGKSLVPKKSVTTTVKVLKSVKTTTTIKPVKTGKSVLPKKTTTSVKPKTTTSNSAKKN